MQAERKRQQDKEYLAYVRGAVDRMEPKKPNWKMKVYDAI